MFLGGPAPLPGEYRFLELEQRGLRRCARPTSESACSSRSIAQAPSGGRRAGRGRRGTVHVNIDHHHDNPRFGNVNLIVPDASSTGEVLADVFPELGLALTPQIAEALYIALVTDTGRFQYSKRRRRHFVSRQISLRRGRTSIACSKGCMRTSSLRS